VGNGELWHVSFSRLLGGTRRRLQFVYRLTVAAGEATVDELLELKPTLKDSLAMRSCARWGGERGPDLAAPAGVAAKGESKEHGDADAESPERAETQGEPKQRWIRHAAAGSRRPKDD
jgi:hypothetical protein